MSSDTTPVTVPWHFQTPAERDKAIEVLRHDAEFLSAQAQRYEDNGENWLARKVRKNAANSKALAAAIESN